MKPRLVQHGRLPATLEASLAEHYDVHPLWAEADELVRSRHPALEERERTGATIRAVIDREVEDVIRTSAVLIAEAGVASVEDVRRQEENLIRYSHDLL